MERVRPPRAIRVETIDANAAAADQLSLFAVVHIKARPEWRGRPLFDDWVFLTTAGFARSWSAALAGQPKRFEKIDHQTIDRFVAFEANASNRSLVTVEIREAYCYDLPYRSDIAAIGISFRVLLHPQAMESIAGFLRTHPGLDHGAESSSTCVFRFPVKREIPFPEPRGLENPYDGSSLGLDAPADIATIRSDSLEMAVVVHPSSPAAAWQTEPLGRLVGSAGVLRLSF